MGSNQVLILCFKDENMIDFFDDIDDDFFEDSDDLKIWHAMKKTQSNYMPNLFECWDKQDRMKLIAKSLDLHDKKIELGNKICK